MSPLWKDRRTVIILGGLLFAHLVLISAQVPLGSDRSLLGRALFRAFAPLQRAVAGAAAAVSGAWNGFVRLRGVRAEAQRLAKDLFFARQEAVLLRERLRFAEGEAMLRRNLEALSRAFVAARVIGLDAGNPYASIVINRGAADGVRANLAVCDRHGHLVGRVVEPVAYREARVQLITDGEAGVSVVSSTDRVIGVLAGDAAGGCVLRYVMATTPGGREGEDLFTTGFDKLFPPGIGVGRIVSVVTDASLFKTIRVAPFFRFNDLDQVAVITGRFEELF